MSEEMDRLLEILKHNPKLPSMTPEQREEWERKVVEYETVFRAIDASGGASALLDARAQLALREEPFEVRMAMGFIHAARHMDGSGTIPPEAIHAYAGREFILAVMTLVDQAVESFSLERLPAGTLAQVQGMLAATLSTTIIQTWYAASNGECLLFLQHQPEEEK